MEGGLFAWRHTGYRRVVDEVLSQLIISADFGGLYRIHPGACSILDSLERNGGGTMQEARRFA